MPSFHNFPERVTAALKARGFDVDLSTVATVFQVMQAYQNHPTTRMEDSKAFYLKTQRVMADFGLQIDASVIEAEVERITEEDNARLRADIRKGMDDLREGNRHTPEAQMVNDAIGVVDGGIAG